MGSVRLCRHLGQQLIKEGFFPDQGSGAWVADSYDFAVVPSVGHFPHEEDPERFDGLVLPWMARLART